MCMCMRMYVSLPSYVYIDPYFTIQNHEKKVFFDLKVCSLSLSLLLSLSLFLSYILLPHTYSHQELLMYYIPYTNTHTHTRTYIHTCIHTHTIHTQKAVGGTPGSFKKEKHINLHCGATISGDCKITFYDWDKFTKDVCMYVCMYVCLCVCICMYACVCMCMCV